MLNIKVIWCRVIKPKSQLSQTIFDIMKSMALIKALKKCFTLLSLLNYTVELIYLLPFSYDLVMHLLKSLYKSHFETSKR